MEFFSRMMNWAKKEVTTTWQTVWGSDGQDRVTPGTLMDNDKNWVYVCVDKIADSVSAIPLKLMKYNKNGDDTEVYDHPALNLLDRPNEQMTGRDFRYITMTHLELTGNAYWLKDKPKNPTTLFPLNPRYVTPKLAKDGMSIDSYTFRAAGGQVGSISTTVYQPDSIIHPKYPNPKSPLIGRGTLEPIAEWVDVDNYATEYNRRFFLNSATFGGAIQTEATSEDALTKVQMAFNNNHKGLQNAHKFIFLPKGSELNDTGVTPKDMQMQQADATFRDKILAAFGVPKSVVGIVEDVNRANAESSNYVFSVFTVKPKTDRLVTYLNEFYLPLFPGTDQMYFTYDDPTPENATLEITENQASLGNAPWKSVNEVRAEKGLPPIDGGDVVNTLTTLIPINTIDLPEGEDAEIEPEPAKAMRLPRSVDKTSRAVDSIVDKVAPLFLKSIENGQMEIEHKEFINRVTIYEQQFEKATRDHDQRQKQEVLNLLKDLDITKHVSTTDLFDKEKEIAKMESFATPIVLKVSKDEGERATLKVANQQLNNFIKKDYSVSSRLNSIIEASIRRMSRSYTQTTLDLLVLKINEGIDEGYSIDKIASIVSEVYGLSEAYRALRIARTEVFSAANDASKDAYIQSGVVKTIRWKTAEDELVCPFCGPLDNTVISVEESFFKKGDTVEGVDQDGKDVSMNVDYENIGNPPLHPQCRCFILPDVITVKEVSKSKIKRKKVDGDVWDLLAQLVDEE